MAFAMHIQSIDWKGFLVRELALDANGLCMILVEKAGHTVTFHPPYAIPYQPGPNEQLITIMI
jgi:hypothetical protein